MQLLDLGQGFWNIRGSFRIGGLLDIGTQASLLRLASGGFAFLDSLTLDQPTLDAVQALTDGGRQVEAILNLHPFHTVHVEAMHAAFPQASLYGTVRHQQRFPGLPWAPERTESPELHARFAADLAFSVPQGVDFVPRNPNLHFSSVLAFHRASGSLHVDDTLVYARLPGPLRRLGSGDRLGFHPTLGQVLEKRAGAAADFRSWAQELIRDWADARQLCAAHTHALINAGDPPLMQRVTRALARVERVLARHERRYG